MKHDKNFPSSLKGGKVENAQGSSIPTGPGPQNTIYYLFTYVHFISYCILLGKVRCQPHNQLSQTLLMVIIAWYHTTITLCEDVLLISITVPNFTGPFERPAVKQRDHLGWVLCEIVTI